MNCIPFYRYEVRGDGMWVEHRRSAEERRAFVEGQRRHRPLTGRQPGVDGGCRCGRAPMFVWNYGPYQYNVECMGVSVGMPMFMSIINECTARCQVD